MPISLSAATVWTFVLGRVDAEIIIPIPTASNNTELGTPNIDTAVMLASIYTPEGGWVGSGSWDIPGKQNNSGPTIVSDGFYTVAKSGRSFIYGHKLAAGGADAGNFEFSTDITQSPAGGISVGNFSIWLTSSTAANPEGSMDPTHTNAAAEFVGGANYVRVAGLSWDFYNAINIADVSGAPGTDTTLTSPSFTIGAADTWMVIAFTQDPGVPSNALSNPATYGTGFGNFLVTTAVAVLPLALEVESSGSDLVFTWESKAGKIYDIVSNTDLLTDPGDWTIWQTDIEATPDQNVETYTRPGDGQLFFALIEDDAPPPPAFFSEDFDDAASLPLDWLSNGPSNGTDWEVGIPTVAPTGPTAASSTPNCVGTNIAGDHTANVDIKLTTPSFAIPMDSGANLSFRQFIDTDVANDFGSVRILDADDSDAVIAGLEILNIEGNGTGSSWTSESLAMTSGQVGGKNIKIEFQFVSDGVDEYGGFYVDDVMVIAP